MKQPISVLKNFFSAFKMPTGSNFGDMIDSFFHKDGKIPAANIEGWTDDSAIEIIGNELPELADKNKYVEVLGGENGRTLTYKGTPFAITKDSLAVMFWSGSLKLWKKQDESPIPKGSNGKTIEKFNPLKEGGYPTGSQVFFLSAVWESSELAAKGESPSTNPSKWGNAPVLLSGVQFVNKQIVLEEQVIGSNERYTVAAAAPGYVISSVPGRVRLKAIDVTPGTRIDFENLLVDSGNANEGRFWTDAQGSKIASMENSRIAPFSHIVPRDAKFLMLSFASANDITKAVVKQVTNEIPGYELKQTYAISTNLSNGYFKGYEVQALGIGANAQGGGGWVSNLIPVQPGGKYNIYGNYFSFGGDHGAIFYDKNMSIINFISAMPSEDRAVNTSMVAKLFSITAPPLAAFVRYEVAKGTTSVTNFETISTSVHYFFNSENFRQIIFPENGYEQLNQAKVAEIVKKEKPVSKELSKKTILMFGTSIENTGFAQSTVPYSGDKLRGTTGGWVGRFLDIVRPAKFYNYASGGYTLTDTSGLTGTALATGGSTSFLRQLEIFINDYNVQGSTLTAPDIVIICGCTNDFGQSTPRYITDSEISAANKSYDKYIEESFFLQNDLPIYNDNRLIPLENIRLSKIPGALRYIVQRLGTMFPSVKFFIVTPIQSTAHALFQQRACVRDYKWTANRLSIPIIDAWGESNQVMLWDYKDVNGVDNHKLLVDNVHMASLTVTQPSVNIMARFVANSLYNRYFDY